jgi:ABC-type branched-subunit amino acid transport system substrate-binding protein
MESQPPDAAAALVDYLVSRNIKKIAICYMQIVAFSICDDEIKKAAEKAGIEVVDDTHFPPGEITDFRIELLKIKEKNPEIIVLMSLPPEVNIIGHQIKQIGWNVPLTSINSFEQSGEYDLWNGYVSVGSIDLNGKFAKEFYAQYKRQTIYPGFIYDALTLLNNAYENCGRDVSKLPEAVQSQTPFEGIVGQAVNDNGTFKYKPFLVKMVNGMPKKL